MREKQWETLWIFSLAFTANTVGVGDGDFWFSISNGSKDKNGKSAQVLFHQLLIIWIAIHSKYAQTLLDELHVNTDRLCIVNISRRRDNVIRGNVGKAARNGT